MSIQLNEYGFKQDYGPCEPTPVEAAQGEALYASAPRNVVNCDGRSVACEIGSEAFGLVPAPFGGWYVYVAGERTHHDDGRAAALAYRAAYGAALEGRRAMEAHFVEYDAKPGLFIGGGADYDSWEEAVDAQMGRNAAAIEANVVILGGGY